MSRGGRGGGRGGFGGGGRGGFGPSNLPPMGLSFADIQSMSREATELYPALEPLPLLTEYSEDERQIAQIQLGFSSRLRRSAYFIVEPTKSTDLSRYSDKYRPSLSAQPSLKRKDLHQPFFPPEIFEGYFNPKKRKTSEKKNVKKRVNLDDMAEDADDKEGSEDDASQAGSAAVESDYDDEEEDNDYEANYFDNGEGDDNDDLGDGAGGGDGGGYDDI